MSEELELKLSLVRKSRKVSIEVEPGRELKCTLRELTGAGRDSYMNSTMSRMQIKDGKVEKVTSFDGLQSKLITLCLFKENGDAFTEQEVQNFPATMQNELYKAAQKLNGMGAEAETEAKNV